MPPELSIKSIARELQSAGLAQMGQGVRPDDVVGLLLLTPQLLQLLAVRGDSGDLVAPAVVSARLEELEGTASVVAAAGSAEITLEAPSSISIVRIFEVIGDSDAIDFDVAIFEDQGRTRLNRVYLNTANNLHFVDRVLEGQDYRDRESDPGQADKIYITVTNNDASPQDITVRVKFRSEADVI